jgi:hypothetical protein
MMEFFCAIEWMGLFASSCAKMLGPKAFWGAKTTWI